MRFQTIKQTLFLSMLIFITGVFLWIIKPFLGSIFWAAVFAIIFYPLNRRWISITRKRRVLSSIFTILTIFFIVFVPLYFIGDLIVRESITTYQRITSNPEFVVESYEKMNSILPVGEVMERFGLNKDILREKIIDSAQVASQYLFTKIAKFGQNTLKFVIDFFVLFYVLYFFLKDGPAILERLMHLLPLGDRKEQRLFDRFASTTRATIKGTIIIGLVQGIIGGILFWSVGVSAPVLWGALMALLSIIPAVGSFLVWAPVGIVLLLMGSVFKGVLVLLVGTFVIGLIDNVLRPPLVGRDTEMPEALILLSTLGGISAFGITGFVIGPVIAAFFLAMWEMFEKEFHRELTREG